MPRTISITEDYFENIWDENGAQRKAKKTLPKPSILKKGREEKESNGQTVHHKIRKSSPWVEDRKLGVAM